MASVRQTLQAALDERGGAIPFDAFMGVALHDPGCGYYARNIRGIGPFGDFTTVPQISTAPGNAVARWLREAAAAREWKNFHAIECGPGDGSLAAGALAALGWLGRRRVTLHLVETSAPLRGLQKAKLHGKRVHWHDDISSALDACEGRALIYHNEFFDAFPCRVFRKENCGWSELHLRVEGGRLAEVFLPPQRPLPGSEIFGNPWPDGQRVEVLESVCAWMRDLAASWRDGAMLAIDYGGTAETIYHRRPGGTLRAYRGQQRLAGEAVYEIPGRQDITADVNFRDLAKWAAELGWAASDAIPLTELAPDAPGAAAFRGIIFTKSSAAP